MAWTVLLVDDSRTIQEIVRMTLRTTPFSLLTAASLRDGLDAARRARPDVVLADVRLPDGDGYGLCRELKADPELASIPVLLFIGASQTPDVARSKEVRAMGFFPKPFSSQDLIDQLTLLSEARSRKPEAPKAAPVPEEGFTLDEAPQPVEPEPAFAFDEPPAEFELGGEQAEPLAADEFALGDAPDEAFMRFDEPEQPPAPADDFALDAGPTRRGTDLDEEAEPLLEIEPFDFSEPEGAGDPEWQLEDDRDLIRTDEVLSRSGFDLDSDPMGMLSDSDDIDAQPAPVPAPEAPAGPLRVTREEASFMLEEIADDEEEAPSEPASSSLDDAMAADFAAPGDDLDFAGDLGLEPVSAAEIPQEPQPEVPEAGADFMDELEPVGDLDVMDDLEPIGDLEPIDDLEPLEAQPLAVDEALDEGLADDQLDGDLDLDLLDDELGEPLPVEDLEDLQALEGLRRQRLSDFDTPVPVYDAEAERLDPVAVQPAHDEEALSFALEEDEDIDLARTVPHVSGDLVEDQPILASEAIVSESEPEFDTAAILEDSEKPQDAAEDLTFDLTATDTPDADDPDVDVEIYEIAPQEEPAGAPVWEEEEGLSDAATTPSGDDIVALFRRALREELAGLRLPETRLAPGTREAIREVVREELTRALSQTPMSRPEPPDDDMIPGEPMDQTELLTAVRQAVRHEVTETLESVVVEALESMTRKVIEAASSPIGPAEMEDLVGRICGREIAVALESFPKPVTPPGVNEIADALSARIMGPLDEIRRTLANLPRYERMGEEVHTWIHSALGELPTADEIRAMLAGLGGASPVAPSASASALPDSEGLRAMLREELAGLVGERLEAVAWEVVPDLAEQIIKKELDRLTT